MTVADVHRDAGPGPTLLALAVTDAAAYSLIGPVLPTLADETGASVTTMTMLAATFPLTMLIGFVPVGRLVHRGHTKVALLLGLALLAVGSLAFVVTSALWVLFIARAVMGLGSAGLWMGVTFRTLEYWPGQEYRRMSRVYAAYSIGALVGPLLAALNGTHLPFLAYLVLLAAVTPFLMLLPSPTQVPRYERDHSWRRSPGFWYAALAIMFAMLGTGLIDGVLPLHFATHLTQSQIGIAYAGTAVVLALASMVAGHHRHATALLVGGLGLVVGITVAGVSGAVPVWAVTLAVTGLGIGAAQTGATGVLLDVVPTARIVVAMTVWSQMGIGGYLIGPAVGGPVVEHLGFAWLGIVPAAVGLAVVIAALIARRSEPAPAA